MLAILIIACAAAPNPLFADTATIKKTEVEGTPHYFLHVQRGTKQYRHFLGTSNNITRAIIQSSDFGPGLIHVMLMGHKPDQPRSKTARDRGLDRFRYKGPRHILKLFHIDRRVSHSVLSKTSRSAGVRRAGVRYDKKTRVLTFTMDPRLPPQKARCMKPRPIRTRYKWNTGKTC